MELYRTLSLKEKALKVNLDLNVYGSFAEIGAGQETAAHFFKVGGASGTIAKTMSAYDMKFSDAIYGKTKRYVSEERLIKMLEHEFQLLIERLPDRVENTKFFVFANTVETLNFKRTNQGHGWLGLRFQLAPNTPFNECILHVLLRDADPVWQQQAMGILGVNLIHGCNYISDPEELMRSLQDNITPGRLELDYFRLTGPDFKHVDNRLMALKLVKFGLTRATMFDADGKVHQPTDALYKKSVLILRGRFRPLTRVNMDMIQAAQNAFKNEKYAGSEEMVTLSELTLNDLSGDEGISDKDFLHRVDILGSLGLKVMISDYQKYYMLADYISQLTRGRIRIVLGFNSLEKLFDESYYTELKGGILESFGRLFKKNLKIYVYPSLQAEGVELQQSHSLQLPDPLNKLFQYLCDNNQIEDLQPSSTAHLNIYSDEVLRMIRQREEGWQRLVPEEVAKAIIEKGLFDYAT